MSKAPLGIGLIGTGNISRTHAKAYQQFPDLATLKAVYDLDPERANAAAADLGCQAATSLEALLARNDIDAVSVTVPTNHHAAAAVAALNAGKHVLCEKPMAATAEQAKAMVAAAEASGKTLMVAMKWRWRPETIAAKQAVDDGLLGDIYWAQAIGWQHRGVPGRPSFTRKESAGGGGMMDNGIYNLDTILHILGHPKPLTVSAQVGAWFGPKGSKDWRVEDFSVEDFGAAFVRLEGGICLLFAHAWAINFRQESDIQIAGSEGGIEFDLLWAEKPLKITHGTYDELKDVTPDPLPAGNQALGDFPHEIREFLTSIIEGRPSPIPGDPFYHSNLIFDAAFESARQGREVEVNW